jgi:hypothetical protein
MEVFQRRRALRQGFNGRLGEAAIRMGVDPAVLRSIARSSVNDIAFVPRAEPVLPPLEQRWALIGPATETLERLVPCAKAA